MEKDIYRLDQPANKISKMVVLVDITTSLLTWHDVLRTASVTLESAEIFFIALGTRMM